MKKSGKQLILEESKNKNTLPQPESLEEDIYSKENLEPYFDEDIITSEEQAFMLGYLAS